MNKLLEVDHLDKFFKINGGIHKAVNHVSFCIYEGETLGIVGESGCGKTTCGRTCIGIYEKSGGSVTYRGEEVSELRKRSNLNFSKKVQCIFQDPFSSLDPRMKIGETIAEGLDLHGIGKNKAEQREIVGELLSKVGLKVEYADRYPHEFSGGQRQRIGIIRALSIEPEFVFCDEPLSALDISIQAQIMNLLLDLQAERHMTYMFVSHDISMVRHISDRIAVFFMGRIVELAETEEICKKPLHPYTKALLSSLPCTDPVKERKRKRIILPEEIYDNGYLKRGCPFKNQCSYVIEKCEDFDCELQNVGNEHMVACCCI